MGGIHCSLSSTVALNSRSVGYDQAAGLYKSVLMRLAFLQGGTLPLQQTLRSFNVAISCCTHLFTAFIVAAL
jgi:hypothetical protein